MHGETVKFMILPVVLYRCTT